MKTPEQMADEYLDKNYELDPHFPADVQGDKLPDRQAARPAFLAGYKAAQQWISVKDRLPDIYQRVLILIRGRIFISSIEEEYGDEYRDGVIRFWDGDWDWPEVTHWMELPAPPKEEE